MEDYQTTLAQDKCGVAILEEALSEAYDEGWNDAADQRSPRASDVTADPQQLWERLMQLIGVIV